MVQIFPAVRPNIKITSANGVDIPYIGCMIRSVNIGNTHFHECEIFVPKNVAGSRFNNNVQLL